MQSSGGQADLASERLYCMDWLRVAAILAVFLVHSMMPFQIVPGVWLIQFGQTHAGFALFPAFVYQWVMPLFFFLSGAGAQLAMRTRRRGQYLRERSRRLLVPLLFGSLAFTPLQEYLSLQSRLLAGQSLGQASPFVLSGTTVSLAGLSFLGFYPRYLSACLNSPGLGLLRIGCFTNHLWFLAFLFIYSVLCLPLFERLSEGWGTKGLDRLAGLALKPRGWVAFFLPLALIQILLRARFSQHQNWSDFLLWLTCYVYGYLFLSDRRFLEAVRAGWKGAFWIGLGGFAAMLALLGPGGYAKSWEMHPTFSAGYALYQALRSLVAWAWVVFFLGMGLRWFNFKHPRLKEGVEAVLPFYILHQAAIVVLAYALFTWPSPILVKYLALAGGAFLLTAGAYALVVRRVNGLRFLFGMRPTPGPDPFPVYSSLPPGG
jgi:fucose 4-O-acetylase-like acetyltransferase